MSFLDYFRPTFEAVGMSVVSLLIAFCVFAFVNYIIKVIKKQKKIKCLCHHEFEIEYLFKYKKGNEYDLKCRKCGKTKIMKIYHKEGSDLE